MNKIEIAREFAKSIDDPHIERIILFGSVARGEEKEDSDIDLFIVSEDKRTTRDKIMNKVTDFLLEKGVYLSVKVISIDEYNRLKHTHFISQVEKEGIKIG